MKYETSSRVCSVFEENRNRVGIFLSYHPLSYLSFSLILVFSAYFYVSILVYVRLYESFRGVDGIATVCVVSFVTHLVSPILKSTPCTTLITKQRPAYSLGLRSATLIDEIDVSGAEILLTSIRVSVFMFPGS